MPPQSGEAPRFPAVLLTCGPGWNKNHFGFDPGFAPRSYP